MYRLHLLKTAQRVTLGDQLGNGALVQRARDQQNNIVDHVAVRDKVQKSRQGLNSLIAKVLELNHEFFTQLVIDGGNGKGRWFVCQKRAIICALQMQL